MSQTWRKIIKKYLNLPWIIFHKDLPGNPSDTVYGEGYMLPFCKLLSLGSKSLRARSLEDNLVQNKAEGSQSHSLWDPSHKLLCPEDHLIGVALLDHIPIDTAADSQVMGVWWPKKKCLAVDIPHCYPLTAIFGGACFMSNLSVLLWWPEQDPADRSCRKFFPAATVSHCSASANHVH